MPYRATQFVDNEIYHVILRGVDDNLIFKNQDDYYRGVFSIYEFNSVKSITIREQRRSRQRIKNLLITNTNKDPIFVVDGRNKLVEIFSFVFMPNHLHLLLRQIKNRGITKFMSKVGTGYGGYFNRKYSRKGYVFQNRFLSVHIENEEQLKNVFVYIHTNPVSLVESNWKEK